jgi:hypothetical protein
MNHTVHIGTDNSKKNETHLGESPGDTVCFHNVRIWDLCGSSGIKHTQISCWFMLATQKWDEPISLLGIDIG